MKDEMLFHNLDKMFFPNTVAIIGASDVPGKWGFLLTSNILGGGYKGKVLPVNPNKKSIMGLKVYNCLKDIQEDVDLAVITIPANSLPSILEDCIAKGIHAVVVITSGFSEVGNKGAELERRISEIASKGDLTFIGPNTMGIVSAHNNLVAVGAPLSPIEGGLGIISQSGNLGVQIIQWAMSKGIGVGIYAGTGNEALLKTTDILSYFGHRDEVKAIALYVEGIDDGRTFMEVTRQITKAKPVITLKAGRTATGAMAAKSHTGSMAGSFEVYSAVFKQAGVIQVDSPSELLSVAGAMSILPIPRGNRVGIMSLGGGWGVVTADECEGAGLEIPTLSEDIIKDLSSELPSFWNRANPIDLVGEPDPDLHIHALNLLANWDKVDSIIALGIIGQTSFYRATLANQERISGKRFRRETIDSIIKARSDTEKRFLTEMARLQKKTSKPIIAISLGGDDARFVNRIDGYGSVTTLSTPEEAVNIIKHMARYRRYLDNL
ncbi:MAG: CoA-binding protein [Thermodesulfobacteriota bacterium]|nr:CoA-binding protein [Thermodesulfobacteriota bacterium]